MVLSAVFGGIMGLVGLVFLNIADHVPKEWVNNGSFDEASDTDFYAGKTSWIFITGGTGLLVGLVRWLYSYPDNLPGIFKEIGDYHVDPTWSPLTVFISAASLAGGASLGPEQAMGNLGGGMATFVVENLMEFESDNRKLVVLSGMCAALGALFPTPILAVLMIYELGDPPKAYMESVLLLSVAACTSFLVYYSLMEYTYLERLNTSNRVGFSPLTGLLAGLSFCLYSHGLMW
jgi:H+/Cl- antiporter ClcA